MKRIRDMNFEERKAFVAELNVIDDSLFHKIVEDKGAAEEILKVLLNDKGIEVIESYPQDSIKNILGKSVVLDALVKDSNGTIYNVEVQNSNDDNHLKRARYNQSSIDTRFSEKGMKYYNLPNIFEIFIMRFDIFKADETVYNIKSRVDYFKNQEEGVNEMCEWSERILQAGKEEGIKEGVAIAKRVIRAHESGKKIEEIANSEQLSIEEVRSIIEA